MPGSNLEAKLEVITDFQMGFQVQNAWPTYDNEDPQELTAWT